MCSFFDEEPKNPIAEMLKVAFMVVVLGAIIVATFAVVL